MKLIKCFAVFVVIAGANLSRFAQDGKSPKPASESLSIPEVAIQNTLKIGREYEGRFQDPFSNPSSYVLLEYKGGKILNRVIIVSVEAAGTFQIMTNVNPRGEVDTFNYDRRATRPVTPLNGATQILRPDPNGATELKISGGRIRFKTEVYKPPK